RTLNCPPRLSLAESQLAVVETKYTELQKSLQQMLLDKEELIRSHALEMQRQREDRQQQEAGLRKEFDNLTVKCAQLEAQVADSEQRAEQLKAANLELREEVAAVQAEMRLRQAELDERLQTERQQCRDQLLEMESARDRELNQLRAEFESSDRAHRDRQARADRERADLESETARLRAQLQSEKLAAEEAQAGLRARLRAEEEQRVAALEERARLLQSGKEEAAGRAAALAAQLAEQQRAQVAQQAEVEAGKRRLEDAATQLAAARAEGHAEAARVRLEMQERLNSLEAERRSQKELHEEIASLKSELQRCRDESREQLAAKDTQLAVLQERLNARARSCVDGARTKRRGQQRCRQPSCSSAGGAAAPRLPTASRTKMYTILTFRCHSSNLYADI
uniref:Myosin_tail_1 domain-containing protein n=1 Tax=Macrostomum lignano TaxID=282301 RepID=A0A1I8GKC9_9PLAT